MRKQIGYALSNNQVFLGTLLENIAMGRSGITTGDVMRTIEMVNLDQYVSSLPKGLNSVLDPEGRRLPRSVANKIILARAIVNKPKLLMLEDPLDHVPGQEKEEIIQRLTANNTPWSIIVTTVDPIWQKYIPDRIIMQNGTIIENTLAKN